MVEDREGFPSPEIDQTLCNNCDLCRKSCPVLHPVYRNSNKPECYAFRGPDEMRAQSASGALFPLLAEKVLADGGYVAGAAFDSKFEVEHIVISKPEDLPRLKGSKYVQSDIKTVYRELKDLLDANKTVLFTGCPCQVAGLNSFLGKKYDTLITVDLICEGVPAPGTWRRYLQEQGFTERGIESVRFRPKRWGWKGHAIEIRFQDGTEYFRRAGEDSFFAPFLRLQSLRESCGNCPFSRLPRQGDLTIADFWGIDRYDKSLDDNKGTSACLVNSPVGKKLFDEIASRGKTQSVPLDFYKTVAANVGGTLKVNPLRKRYQELLQIKSVQEATDYIHRPMYDAGVLGLWYATNYGCVLTGVALYKALEDMKYSPVMISKPTYQWNGAQVQNTLVGRFASRYFNCTRPRDSEGQMRELNDHVKAFIVGSDQVWNYHCSRGPGTEQYVLDFVRSSNKMISYASSFGNDYFAPDEIKHWQKYYLSRFDHLSVREDFAVDLCKNVFGLKAEWVLDPVFLCDRKHYHFWAGKAKAKMKEKFIVSYILDPNEEKRQALLYAQKETGLRLINLIDADHAVEKAARLNLPDTMVSAEVEDWLYYMANSEMVLTDSFHGTCFAVLLERKFVSFGNLQRGVRRFESLLQFLHLEHRMIIGAERLPEYRHLLSEEVDFKQVYEIIEPEKVRCRAWLDNAIRSPKNTDWTVHDIADGLYTKNAAEIKRLSNRMDELNRKIKRYEMIMDAFSSPGAFLKKSKEFIARKMREKRGR